MIIYSGNKADFMTEVVEDTIAYSIRDNILEKMHRKTGEAEFRSWVNSLEYMYKVLNDDGIPQDSGIAIEYNLPNTAKRVDFLVSGYDDEHCANVVIIELRQRCRDKALGGSQRRHGLRGGAPFPVSLQWVRRLSCLARRCFGNQEHGKLRPRGYRLRVRSVRHPGRNEAEGLRA